MKQWKQLAAIGLAVCVMLALTACRESLPAQGGTESQPPEDIQELTETAEASAVPVLYIVKVTDENGAPIPGAMVQLCSDICVPGVTDGEGVARFTLLPDYYQVSMTVMPQGYAYLDETTEFTFPEGVTELTIVLKAQ